MKREILDHKRYKFIGGCCPGHDTWPDDVYSTRSSVHARAKGKAKEHRLVRRIAKQKIGAFL